MVSGAADRGLDRADAFGDGRPLRSTYDPFKLSDRDSAHLHKVGDVAFGDFAASMIGPLKLLEIQQGHRGP
ncbi:MAG: hypothetical protein JSS66_09200 [Armatimonadetes bacterium]|nr:hypothetical protein [Armatimonadota bacterium]